MWFTLIKSLLDYCNILYVWTSQASIAFLQFRTLLLACKLGPKSIFPLHCPPSLCFRICFLNCISCFEVLKRPDSLWPFRPAGTLWSFRSTCPSSLGCSKTQDEVEGDSFSQYLMSFQDFTVSFSGIFRMTKCSNVVHIFRMITKSVTVLNRC